LKPDGSRDPVEPHDLVRRRPLPPRDEDELLQRAQALAGHSLGAIAAGLRLDMPADLSYFKGWVGMLLETALGADAAGKPLPDFHAIGIELKTITVGTSGIPREATFVCTTPQLGQSPLRWEDCHLRRKLARVLWVPIVHRRGEPLAARRVGSALLWSPTSTEETLLRADWEELMDHLCLHYEDDTSLDLRLGQYLQVRYGSDYSSRQAERAGKLNFYLRRRFTRQLLQHYYLPTR